MAATSAEVEQLITKAIKLVKTYKPSVSTVDAHVRDVLGEFDDDAEDKVFIQQCFYGCIRYKKVLKIFLSSFYFNNSSKILRSDYTRYMILAYITLFRLEDMGMKRFRFLLSSQDATKVHHFLGYLYNMHNIDVWLKDEWVKVLDRRYVEDVLIGTIKKRMDAITTYLENTHDKAFGTMVVSRSDATMDGESKGPPPRPATKFNVPNITKPRPRMAPEPLRIAQTAKANPVPSHLDRTTIARVNKKRAASLNKTRAAVSAKYQEPQNQPFKLHETRTNIDKVRDEVYSERFKECTFGEGFKAKPPPKYPSRGADVKLNAAAVLREDALYKKKQEQDAALIKEYESALRDSTEFYRWQTDMKGQDEARRRAQVEQRRLEMVASQKEAVEAAERRRFENKMLADAMKVESEALREAAEAEAASHLASLQALVSEVQEVRNTAPREAEARVLRERIERREKLNAELEEARLKAEEEARIEQARKDDLIRQIRALERVPKQRVKMFDPTESSGVGLLEEMSLVELKERLELNRQRNEEEEDERRRTILRKKREKEQDLRNRAANISRIRNAASSSNRDARARRKKAEADRLEAERQERAAGNLRVASRIIAKKRARRAEERKLAEEAELIAKQRMFLGAAKAAIEERHFEEQMRGAEREAMERQAGAQHASRTVEKIKATERKALLQRKSRAHKERKEWEADMERRLDDGRRRLYNAEVEEMNEKKEKVRTEKVRHTETLRIRDSMNPYAAEKSLQSVTMGRTAALRRTGKLGGTGRSRKPSGASRASASKEVMEWAAMG